MVPRKTDSHYLSKEKPAKSKPMKETQEKNWDIPLTIIIEETVQEKLRDNQVKRGRYKSSTK